MDGPRCVECGVGLPPSAGRGRPRRYCSRGCQARAYRRRQDRGRTAPARRRPAARGGDRAVTRDELVRVAVRLADADGLDAVSMRAVSHHAGLSTDAVYRWVRNRDDLLAAMAEQVLGTERAGDGAGRTPRERLERLARAEWSLYRRHPWLLAVLAKTRPPTGPAVLALVDGAVDVLTGVGYDPPDAFAGYLALSGFVQGMALLHVAERAERDAGGAAWGSWSTRTFARLERTGRTAERPWLAAAGAVPADPDRELERWFEFGLARLLDGVLP
ncbi:TetR/AcrR family transcriptional regulator [Micromonospora musae]|uniref:TetR/AcrR family transcriptional regulator n=1 Tax=Micromonospora musae TaxID=1894970 RepID=A0ABX9RBU8_9ACTN|nr:TetR/AcrR family transcriptional regulator [Micromonospora musae]RKN21070.1 TetR/AcrR family transcriptional regulator [Micromonospora musae]